MMKRENKNGFLKWSIVILLGGVIAFGVFHRQTQFKQAENLAEDNSLRQVKVIALKRGGGGESISFPGKLDGYIKAAIYSRVNGYLKSWSTDIGAHVKKGEVLAHIESPEVDQQFQQANSELEAAKSNERLAEVTLKRWQKLLTEDAVSVQETDLKAAELESRRSLRKVAESNLERATKFLDYKNIQSPFDGILTERNADIGILVNSGAGKPLFVIANIDKLRLYVNVPQVYLNDIRPGIEARVSVPEYVGKEFKGEVVRSSGAVNENSGASLIEVEIDNKQKLLTSGAYAQVKFVMPANQAKFRVPASALMIRKDGTFIAEVNAQNMVEFKPVKVVRDFGLEMEIFGDISEQSRVIETPADTLINGEKVSVLTSGTGS